MLHLIDKLFNKRGNILGEAKSKIYAQPRGVFPQIARLRREASLQLKTLDLHSARSETDFFSRYLFNGLTRIPFRRIKEDCELMIGELAALGAAICWAISAVLYRKALSSVKPIPANVVRCACTSLVLLAVLAVVGRFQVLTSLPANAIVLASVSGVIGLGIGDSLYMVSLKLVGVGRAVPITCTYPLFSLVFAILIRGQTVTIQVVFAAVVIVFGIWLLTRGDDKGKDQFQRGIMTKGVIAAVATAIVWSVSITMIDIAVTLPETGTLDGALAINTLRVSSVAAFLLVSASIANRKRSLLNMQRKTVAILMFAGIIALALGWFFLAYSFLHIPEAQAVPISSTSPLFATFSSIIFLNERLTVKNIAGSLLIVVGVFLLFIV